MGQVLSYIWRCLRRPNVEDDSTTTTTIPQNDEYSTVEEQSYYITIPDEDLYMAQPDVITEALTFIGEEEEEEEEEENEEEEEEEVTSQVLAAPIQEYNATEETVRRIGSYNSMQKILLVGEGDFSFSTSLALAFGSASNMIATSLNPQEFLTKNYRKFRNNKKELEIRGCKVIHEVDATNMIQHPVLGNLTFDCIIYNFPHTGNFDTTDAAVRENQNLVREFVRNAKKMMNEDGEIHITHKSSSLCQKWDIPKIGSDQGLLLIEEIDFKRNMYPGYITKYGFGSDKFFHCNPSKTYKFGLHPK